MAWLADGIGTHRYNLDQLPKPSEIPADCVVPNFNQVELTRLLVRWTQLLCLIQIRPQECGRVLARALSDGDLPHHALSRALRIISPRLELESHPTASDTDYIELELQHLESATYEVRLALAYRAVAHNASFAYQVAEDAASQAPESFDADLCLAAICERTGAYGKACDHYAIAARKGCADCHVLWARAANLAGRPQTALDIVEAASVERTPELALEGARALRGLGRDDDALARYRALGDAGLPQRGQVEAEMGAILLGMGRSGEAIRVAGNAARSRNQLACRVVGIAHHRERAWRDAAHFLQRYCAERADDFDALRSLAECQFRMGDEAAAVGSARLALQVDDQDRRTAGLLACLLVRQGQLDEALELCRQYGWSVVPLSYLVRLLVDLGQLGEASEAVSQWVNARPNDANAWAYLAYLAELMQQHEQALEYYEQACRRNPRDRALLDRYERLARAIESGAIGQGDTPPPALPAGD